MHTAGKPRCRAISKPGASGRFEMTAAISAESWPAPIRSAIASRFDPRPEIRMPRRLTGTPHGDGRVYELLLSRYEKAIRPSGSEFLPPAQRYAQARRR